MIEILVKEDYKDQIGEEKLRLAALAVLAHQEQPHDSEISIRISDEEEITALNQKFRGENKATDVLSFPAREINPETKQVYLGDICIALPTVKSQAQKHGHTIIDELQLMVVHGCLHLLGYDHHEAEEKNTMWQIQEEIMETLGVKIDTANLA